MILDGLGSGVPSWAWSRLARRGFGDGAPYAPSRRTARAADFRCAGREFVDRSGTQVHRTRQPASLEVGFPNQTEEFKNWMHAGLISSVSFRGVMRNS
jgi:hypothetical protein